MALSERSDPVENANKKRVLHFKISSARALLSGIDPELFSQEVTTKRLQLLRSHADRIANQASVVKASYFLKFDRGHLYDIDVFGLQAFERVAISFLQLVAIETKQAGMLTSPTLEEFKSKCSQEHRYIPHAQAIYTAFEFLIEADQIYKQIAALLADKLCSCKMRATYLLIGHVLGDTKDSTFDSQILYDLEAIRGALVESNGKIADDFIVELDILVRMFRSATHSRVIKRKIHSRLCRFTSELIGWVESFLSTQASVRWSKCERVPEPWAPSSVCVENARRLHKLYLHELRKACACLTRASSPLLDKTRALISARLDATDHAVFVFEDHVPQELQSLADLTKKLVLLDCSEEISEASEYIRLAKRDYCSLVSILKDAFWKDMGFPDIASRLQDVESDIQRWFSEAYVAEVDQQQLLEDAAKKASGIVVDLESWSQQRAVLPPCLLAQLSLAVDNIHGQRPWCWLTAVNRIREFIDHFQIPVEYGIKLRGKPDAPGRPELSEKNGAHRLNVALQMARAVRDGIVFDARTRERAERLVKLLSDSLEKAADGRPFQLDLFKIKSAGNSIVRSTLKYWNEDDTSDLVKGLRKRSSVTESFEILEPRAELNILLPRFRTLTSIEEICFIVNKA